MIFTNLNHRYLVLVILIQVMGDFPCFSLWARVASVTL